LSAHPGSAGASGEDPIVRKTPSPMPHQLDASPAIRAPQFLAFTNYSMVASRNITGVRPRRATRLSTPSALELPVRSRGSTRV